MTVCVWSSMLVGAHGHVWGRVRWSGQMAACGVEYAGQLVVSELSESYVTFDRRAVLKDRQVNWEHSETLFTNLHATSTGRIETDGAGMLQVRSV